jgi:hypothetical protein
MQTALVVLGVAAGVAVWWFWWKPFGGNEDRPEIVVRNRKLRIKTGKDWKDQGSRRKWKPDHPNGKSVKEFKVTVRNANESQCASELTGRKVTITYKVDSVEHTVELVRNRRNDREEPMVDADVDLEHDNNDRQVLKIKLDPEGGIVKVKVQGHPACTFPQDPTQDVVVRVDMTYE